MTMEGVEISCLECDVDFSTSRSKCIGEKFNCPHCGVEMFADDDVNDDGELIWFPNRK